MVRPGLRQFLEFVFSDPRIGTVSIWTASTGRWPVIYARLLRPLMPAHASFFFVWEGDRCLDAHPEGRNGGNGTTLKPLKKVWRRYHPGMNRRNTLILDDTPSTYARNIGNAVRVRSFQGQTSVGRPPDDRELARLVHLLNTTLLDAPDVREVRGKRLL